MVGGAKIWPSTAHDPMGGYAHPPDGREVDLALMCDVYHHLEYPRTACRAIRSRLHPERGRLVVIDFYRDPQKVTSHPPEWVMGHLRAGQEVFREEILSSGFVLVAEPLIPGLEENYVMIFRPMTKEEWGARPGGGWSSSAPPPPPPGA